MKKKGLKLNKKLVLGKETVTTLNGTEQTMVRGGGSNVVICFQTRYTCESLICTFVPNPPTGGTTYEPTMPTIGMNC